MADTESKVDSTIGGLANLSNAPDDALVVLEYLGKAYNSTMGQLKAALGAITGFAKTAGNSTPGTNDVYTITFGNGGKLDITIPIPTNGKNGYTPQKGVDYNDGYTPQKGVDYHDGYTPQKGVDYNDGFSPTVDFKQMEYGVEITITDATGPHTAKLKNGADGVSPSFRVETIEGGYRVILSAAHEYQQFDLLNGESGDWNVNNPTWKGFIKGRTHWKEEYGVDGVVIEETSVTFSGTTQFQTISGIMSEAIQVGGKYTVTYNDVDYACIGKYYDGAYIGNGSFMNVGVGNEEDTGEPFCIQLFGGDIYMLWKADKTKETVTVKVVGEKVVIWHKLDKGYLDEALQFGETVIYGDTLTWDGNTDGMVGVELAAGVGIYKVSDSVPTKEDCANGMVVTFDGEEIFVPGEDAQAMFADDGFFAMDLVVFVPADNYYFANMEITFPEAGVYFLYENGMFVPKLVIPGYTGFAETNVTKINKKFLPDGLGKLIVNITPENAESGFVDGGPCVADKTLGEILVAAEAGWDVWAHLAVNTGNSSRLTCKVPLTDFIRNIGEQLESGVAFTGPTMLYSISITMMAFDLASTTATIDISAVD